MNGLGQLTLVKVVQHMLFDGDVSESLLIEYNNRLHPEVKLKNEEGDELNGEIVEGYIDSITLMGEREYLDEIISLKNHSNLRVVNSFLYKAGKNINIDDAIRLSTDSDKLYTLVMLNDQYFLCDDETKKCIVQDIPLFSLEKVELYLTEYYPNYTVFSKLK